MFKTKHKTKLNRTETETSFYFDYVGTHGWVRKEMKNVTFGKQYTKTQIISTRTNIKRKLFWNKVEQYAKQQV